MATELTLYNIPQCILLLVIVSILDFVCFCISVIDGITLYANLLVLKLNYGYLIIIIILKCYSFYPVGDYDYTHYDCECRVGKFLFITLTYIYFLNTIIIILICYYHSITSVIHVQMCV